MTPNAEKLIDKWINDETFRQAIRRDREGAVRAAGMTLSAEERDALGAIDWNQSDEQLAERASKMGG